MSTPYKMDYDNAELIGDESAVFPDYPDYGDAAVPPRNVDRLGPSATEIFPAYSDRDILVHLRVPTTGNSRLDGAIRLAQREAVALAALTSMGAHWAAAGLSHREIAEAMYEIADAATLVRENWE